MSIFLQALHTWGKVHTQPTFWMVSPTRLLGEMPKTSAASLLTFFTLANVSSSMTPSRQSAEREPVNQ